jgi:hypothetical protein
MRKIINKKAQAEGIITFFALAIAILIVSIIVLRLVNEILTPLTPIIGNYSAPAGTTVSEIHSSFTIWWDYVIVLLLAINIIVLFISSFMVDIHPAYVLIYIVAVLFLILMSNFMIGAVDNVWYHVGRASIEGTQTPLQQFIINNFQMIMLGIILLSGVLMYAKIKYFGQNGGQY